MLTANENLTYEERTFSGNYKVGQLDTLRRFIFWVPCMMHVTTLYGSSKPWSDKGSEARNCLKSVRVHWYRLLGEGHGTVKCI